MIYLHIMIGQYVLGQCDIVKNVTSLQRLDGCLG